jgi:hypothetical protein
VSGLLLSNKGALGRKTALAFYYASLEDNMPFLLRVVYGFDHLLRLSYLLHACR